MSISSDAIVSIDDDNRIILFNEGAERTFGYRRDEVLGQPLGILLPDRFRAAHDKHIRAFSTSPEVARLMGERQEVFALHKDGHEFPADAAICKLDMHNQRVFTVLLRDVTDRKQREAHARLLMGELEHRVKNILARVQIVIERSACDQSSVQEFREALLARIASLARVHDLLGQTSWHGVTLTDLIADQLQPYLAARSSRIEGPEIVLNADATQALSMVIHELATNAVKHGALSAPDGRVTVSWRQERVEEAGEVLLQWTEEGGPEVKPPRREGYGTMLIRELLTFELNGTVDLQYSRAGLTCKISLPVDRSLAKLG
jgi:PAS domain S-box-containing protein